MNVLFVTPYYPPEVGAPQTRIFELGVRLARQGHNVRVLTTFPSYPSGIVPPEWRGKFFRIDSDQGITVNRVWSYAAPNRGFFKRILSHFSFALFATLTALFLKKPDVMIIESPPLFDGFVGVTASALRGIPYAFMVSDLWPESAVQMGMLKNGFVIGLAKGIELLFYRRAAAVLALTNGIREGILRDGISEKKVILFRNSVDCEFFHPDISGDRMRVEIGIGQNDFMVLYAGTFGLAQNLGTIIEAARRIQSDPDMRIRFVLAGDGAEAAQLRERSQRLNVENLILLPSFEKARMPELINAADCVLVPLRNLDVFRGALPTKMFEAMACSKPIVLGVRGEAEIVVSAAKCGLCIAPENPDAVCDAVRVLRRDRAAASQMGDNGRAYTMSHFSRDARARELSEMLQSMLDVHGGIPDCKYTDSPSQSTSLGS